MAFSFSLASLLRLRESIERQEELALQRILVEISQVQHRVDAVIADIERARRQVDRAMQQIVPAIHLESMTNQILDAVQLKQELLVSLAQLHQKRDLQSRKFREAHNSRRMLSDMQARQIESYLQERARAEQKALDDLFAHRSRRN